MELFPNGNFVRLRSRANKKYIHADEDWVGVSLRALGRGRDAPPSLESVWRVEHWVTNQGTVFLRLQGAAYGRYLALSPAAAPPGHRGLRAVQTNLDEPDIVNTYLWRWRVERVDPAAAAAPQGQGQNNYVRLRHFDRDLRANGRHRTWNTAVSVDVNQGPTLTTMMQWSVHHVGMTFVPRPLPPATPTPQPPQDQGGRRGRLLFWRRTGPGPGVQQPLPRTIRHVRADDQGVFDQNHHNWSSFETYDHSVFNLRIRLGQLQNDWAGDMLGFTLCVRPGPIGRLIPLIADLPRTQDPLYIVVFRTGSPGAAFFMYPIL